MGILATIVVGLLAGFLASLVMKSVGGLIMDLILGVIGGFIGGYLSQVFFGQNFMTGINLTSILTAAVGAIVLIGVVRLVRR